MPDLLQRLFLSGSSDFRRRTIGVYGLLAAGNVAAWVWAGALFHTQPFLLGTALIAYGFGLRHAIDPDHIAAIDNVTRKLVQEDKRPVSVGLWFAIGHSLVVAIGAAAMAMASIMMAKQFEPFRQVGSVISTIVSASFLFLIAAINMIVLISVYRSLRGIRRGEVHIEADLHRLLNRHGLLVRLFRPLFRLISQSWHMLPLGFLFGLGFDTATEVGLLGIAASETAKGVSVATVMVFPALFAAGMSLVDTTDGILMLRIYDWAFVKPVRKLYYNLIITLVSVLVAVMIGGIEVLGLLADNFQLTSPFWHGINILNDNFTMVGLVVIGLFLGSWIVCVSIYYARGFHQAAITPAQDP